MLENWKWKNDFETGNKEEGAHYFFGVLMRLSNGINVNFQR